MNVYQIFQALKRPVENLDHPPLKEWLYVFIILIKYQSICPHPIICKFQRRVSFWNENPDCPNRSISIVSDSLDFCTFCLTCLFWIIFLKNWFPQIWLARLHPLTYESTVDYFKVREVGFGELLTRNKKKEL